MADSKLRDLDAVGTPVLTDLLYLLADPGGSPLDRKMTLTQLQALISGMVKIEEQTPSATGTLTFSSLGTYTHLRLVWTARGDTVAAETSLSLRFNADTGGNYDRQHLLAFATSTSAGEGLGATLVFLSNISAASATAGAVGSGVIDIPDYLGTTFHKTVNAVSTYKQGTASGNIRIVQSGGHWRNTAAVTSVTLLLGAGNFVAGSKFTLYGMK